MIEEVSERASYPIDPGVARDGMVAEECSFINLTVSASLW